LEPSINHCCSDKAKTHSVCALELHVTPQKKVSVAQECSYCKYMSPVKLKLIYVFILIARCWDLTKVYSLYHGLLSTHNVAKLIVMT